MRHYIALLLNSFFGYDVVERIKAISFDDSKEVLSNNKNKEINVTLKKYQSKIKDIKNDKIKKSLIEFARVFKQK